MMPALTTTRQAAAKAHLPLGGRGRRNGPLAVAGVLLVAGCALAFTLVWLQAGQRVPVLAVARPIPAGQVIMPADLAVVRASVSSPASVVAASQEVAVTGHAAATALPAGSLLAPGDIGTPPPAPGQVVVGVALKPGQYPPDLAAGQRVDVLAIPTGSTGGGTGGAVALPAGQAVVISVSAPDASGVAVAELRVRTDAMPQVAAASAAGQIDLAVTGPGGG